MNYDHRGDGVPTNRPGEFKGDDGAADDKLVVNNYREKRGTESLGLCFMV